MTNTKTYTLWDVPLEKLKKMEYEIKTRKVADRFNRIVHHDAGDLGASWAYTLDLFGEKYPREILCTFAELTAHIELREREVALDQVPEEVIRRFELIDAEIIYFDNADNIWRPWSLPLKTIGPDYERQNYRFVRCTRSDIEAHLAKLDAAKKEAEVEKDFQGVMGALDTLTNATKPTDPRQRPLSEVPTEALKEAEDSMTHFYTADPHKPLWLLGFQTPEESGGLQGYRFVLSTYDEAVAELKRREEAEMHYVAGVDIGSGESHMAIQMAGRIDRTKQVEPLKAAPFNPSLFKMDPPPPAPADWTLADVPDDIVGDSLKYSKGAPFLLFKPPPEGFPCWHWSDFDTAIKPFPRAEVESELARRKAAREAEAAKKERWEKALGWATLNGLGTAYETDSAYDDNGKYRRMVGLDYLHGFTRPEILALMKEKIRRIEEGGNNDNS
jgi:hypothetical protein